MPETLTESFCERCGTRYTFEAAAPKGKRLGKLKVFSKGFVNFVSNDDRSLDEALAEARSDEQRELTGQQLDAFHQTFQFCMSCRQYTCANCWNEVESRCLSCAPQFGGETLGGSQAGYDPLARIGFGQPTPELHLGNGHLNGGAELAPAASAAPTDSTPVLDAAWPTADQVNGDGPAPALPWPELAALPETVGQPADGAPDGDSSSIGAVDQAGTPASATAVPGMAAWEAARAAFIDQPDAAPADDAVAPSADFVDEDVALAVAAAELARHSAAEVDAERLRQADAEAAAELERLRQEAEAESQRQLAAEAEAERQRQAAEAELESQRQLAAEAEAERQRQADEETERQRVAAEAEREMAAAAEAERLRQEAEAERERIAAEAAAAEALQASQASGIAAANDEAQRERQAALEAEALRQRLAVEAELQREREAADAERLRQAAEETERQRQAEIAAAAALQPTTAAPILDDRVETPTWQIVAPETTPTPEPSPLDAPPAVLAPQPPIPSRPSATNGAAAPTNGAAPVNGAPQPPPTGTVDWPTPATTPPPQWPMPQAVAPQWPVGQGTGRGANDDLWAASSQDVLSKAGAGVQSCSSCGLPLSASARFCRRCGTQQH